MATAVPLEDGGIHPADKRGRRAEGIDHPGSSLSPLLAADPPAAHPEAVMDDSQIRERLRKIQTLFAGATSDGERDAAAAALRRIQLKMERARGASTPMIEFRFSLSNPWSLRLFIALCRSKGAKPYRYARMRRTSVCVRADPAFVDHELWPEFQQMDEVLTQYLGELADHIIAECIDADGSDADVVAGLPAPAAAMERSG